MASGCWENWLTKGRMVNPMQVRGSFC